MPRVPPVTRAVMPHRDHLLPAAASELMVTASSLPAAAMIL